MRLALAVFELLLYTCPREFRRAYRGSMRADFYDIASEERARCGFSGLALYICGAYVDIVASGARERSAMIWRDCVYAARSLRRTPFFTAVVIATLAIAIAANAAVFSILDGVLLKPLPYAEPQSLVQLAQTGGHPQKAAAFDGPFSYPNFADVRAETHSFADMAAAMDDAGTMTGHGRPRSLQGLSVSFSYFDVFRVRPQNGRFFQQPDSRVGSAPALVLSDAVYRSAFGSDPAILGHSVLLDGVPETIVGVAPASFKAPEGDRDYWLVMRPSKTDSDIETQRGARYLTVYGRLRSGATIQTAQADVNTVMSNLAHQYRNTNKQTGGHVRSLEDVLVGPVRPLLFGVFAAVAGVLLVACANVANLLLSRAATRRRELAVRYAIGASRARIIAQILTETLMLAVVGGVIGLAFAAAAVKEFIAFRPPGVPRLEMITFDASAALFTFAIVIFCTLAAGLVPALALSRVHLGDELKAAGRGADRSRGARARATFVIAQIAITLALVVASGLVVRSFIALTNTPLGFDPNGVLAVSVPSLPDAKYAHTTQQIAFEKRGVARASTVPGAIDAAWTARAPFGESWAVAFTIPDHPLPSGDHRAAEFNVVSASYFGVLQIPLVRGRLFNDDDRIETPPVIIVNEAFAHEFFGNASPIGKRFKPELSTEGTPVQLWTIVGVTADTRNRYAEPPPAQIYFPNTQIGWSFTGGTFLVRTQRGIDLSALGAAIPALDPQLAVQPVKLLSDALAEDAARTRISALALGTLAAIALFLSIAGIYAVVSYGVAQRTHEFGIRKALGARNSHVLRDVLVRAARLAALGILLGLILAGFAARVVAAQLYGVGLIDPPTYAAVVIIIFGSALIAALIPALRAMRVDPIVALRYE